VYTELFWRELLERALKSAGQFALVAWGAEVANILVADWRMVLSAAAAGAVVSAFTSIASLPIGPVGSASLVDTDPI
jgi:hypothetical protein